MLMGEYQHNINVKGRLIVPPESREEPGEKLAATRGMGGCLFGYPLNEWPQLEAKLQGMPLAKRDARTSVRFFYSAATEYEVDKQGRINIPANLRTHASLERGCVVTGVPDRIEIWSGERWHVFFDEAEENFDELVETVIDFGLWE